MAGPRIKIDILGDASKFKRAVDDVERGAGQMEAKFAGLAAALSPVTVKPLRSFRQHTVSVVPGNTW